MGEVQRLRISHTAEIAHRLSSGISGKCLRIHGHSLQIRLYLYGRVDERGILAGQDFGSIKKTFREYIDGTWDHRLHLCAQDPIVKQFEIVENLADEDGVDYDYNALDRMYPGLMIRGADPTIENISRWIGGWAFTDAFPWANQVRVEVDETNVNGADWESPWRNGVILAGDQ